MILNDEDFNNLREESRTLYSSIGSIRCPYFDNQEVQFTSEGFNHILYRSSRIGRAHKDQIMRFKTLKIATKLIRITTTCQEMETSNQEIIRKFNKRKERITVPVRYWGFTAILEKRKIKVILKKIGNGKLMYWSIIPSWKRSKHGKIVLRDFAEGNLEED